MYKTKWILYSMNEEKIKQQLLSYIDARRNFWAAFIVLTGGIASLILNIDSQIKVFMAIIGLGFDLILFYLVIELTSKINDLLEQM